MSDATHESTMPSTGFRQDAIETERHQNAWIEAGPVDGPLIFFLHGWPELGLVWRTQVEYFAQAGWRCVAPDMRGYGRSSIPTRVADYALAEMVADMLELHDALGGAPAVWVGHDHGSLVAFAMAMHHRERCRAVASLVVPHFARGVGLPTLLPLVDRDLYPVEEFPAGQWDYMQFYAEHFTTAVRDFESHTEQLMGMLFSATPGGVTDARTPLASIRSSGGWFAGADEGGAVGDGATLLPPADRVAWLEAFARNGFSGPCSWYLNDAANLDLAAAAPNFGRLDLPVLFLHGEWDQVCDTAFGRLAEPMREDCTDLTEERIAGGHMLMLERPDAVNDGLERWLAMAVGVAGAQTKDGTHATV